MPADENAPAIGEAYERPRPGPAAVGETEIKRSRFICLIGRAETPEEARAFVDEVRAAYPDATHHCSAYRVHVDAAQPVERSSDDGEPSGTAGRPMLEQLQGSGLLDVAAVVVRYFGGVKLGAGGLVHAYSNSVGDLLPEVPRARREPREAYELGLDHAAAGRVEAELRARGVDVADVSYGRVATLTLTTEPGGGEELAGLIAALTKGEAEPRAVGARWSERAL